MRKLSLFSALVLSLAIAACSSGDDDDDGGDGGGSADAAVGGNPDAAVGGNPDAAATGGGAENLGVPCTGAAPCPNGEACTLLTGIGSETEGFCTISCAGENDNATCQAGFPGPGTAGCLLSDGADPPSFSCGILCTGGPGSCPAGLGCFAAGGGMICAGDEGT